MIFKEMEYVYTVYEERSFTRAAKKMCLSQPALSSMVKKAENRIGAPIFDRSTSPLRLTAVGEYYIRQAERIREIVRESEDHFRRTAVRTEKMLLRMGGAAIYQAYVFPPLLTGFLSHYPEISVTWDESRAGLVQKLLTEEIDFFPDVNNYLSKEVDGIVWRNEELLLAVPAEDNVNDGLEEFRFTPKDIRDGRHREPGARAEDLSHFKDMKYVVMTEENDTCQRSTAICGNAGFELIPSFTRPAQIVTAYLMAEQVNAATFTSDTLVAHADMNRRFFLYKLGDPLAKRQEWLYFRRGRELPAAALLFREYLRGLVQADVQS